MERPSCIALTSLKKRTETVASSPSILTSTGPSSLAPSMHPNNSHNSHHPPVVKGNGNCSDHVHEENPIIAKNECTSLVQDHLMFSQGRSSSATAANHKLSSNWILRDDSLRSLPSYYPLEKSCRFVRNSTPSEIASRISESCRRLSVQAQYDNELGTACLQTCDHVEIHISLWQGTMMYNEEKDLHHDPTQNSAHQDGVTSWLSPSSHATTNTPTIKSCTIVEAQRRKGCPIRYHTYCRSLLDAAQGENPVAISDHVSTNLLGSLSSPRGLLTRPTQLNSRSQRSYVPEDAHNEEKTTSELENTWIALEIAANLLKKDRMDARQLGMESLCLLTDPTRTGIETAILTSQVVLLGSGKSCSPDTPYAQGYTHSQEKKSSKGVVDKDDEESLLFDDELGIREAVLSLIQYGRLAEDGDVRERCDDSYTRGSSMVPNDTFSEVMNPEEKEHNNLLHNLALNVLANALDVLQSQGETFFPTNSVVDDATTNRKIDSAVVKHKRRPSLVDITNRFLQESVQVSHREIISTLLGVLGQAEMKPHNAFYSAKCLRSLFQASIKARRRARELNAKQIVTTALDVGRRSHAKLESEVEKVEVELMKADQEDGDDEEDADGDVLNNGEEE